MSGTAKPDMAALPLSADFADVLDRFEEAWQQGTAPRLDQFLPALLPGADKTRRALLMELVPIDLEYRWRRPGAEIGSPWILEDYVRRFPEVGPLEQLPAALIAEEYRVRRRWGDAPPHAAYAARFGPQRERLEALLRQMDDRLAAEHGMHPAQEANGLPMAQLVSAQPAVNGPSAFAPPSANPAYGIGSVAVLIQTLRDAQVLNVRELHDLEAWATACADPRVLTRKLVERGWLTPFQANEIILGRGRDLTLGPYLLLERIGQGLTGEVFKARHLRMGARVVALKIVRKEFLQDPDVVRRFYKEIEAASRLSHPHIVHPYDAGPIAPTHFLAMEYVDGTNLGRLVKESGRLPVADACAYIRQVALGLQCIQDHGLVHRDIKPSNLVVSGCWPNRATASVPHVVKILDLGLARVWSTSPNSSSTLTQPGAFMGTADYMAPEQAIDPHAVDVRGDLYSLGCTFYYLLTGQPPFPGGTLIQKAEKHRWEEPPPLEQFRPDVPQEVRGLLRQLMAKKPEDRPSPPAAVAAALTPWAGAAADAATVVAAPAAVARADVPGAVLPALNETQADSRTWLLSSLNVRRLTAPRQRLLLLAGAAVCLGSLLILLLALPSKTMPPGTSPAPTQEVAGLPALDLFDPAQIPAEERYPRQPKELVGVIRFAGDPAKLARIYLAFSPDGRWLIGRDISDGDALYLWDMRSRTERTIPRGQAGPFQSAIFSSDSRRLMTTSTPPKANVRLWDVASGTELHRIEGGRVGTYSPDSQHYACEDGKDLTVYETETGREIRRFEGHSTGIRTVAYSSDGSRIATGAGVTEMRDGKPVLVDCTVRLWDAATTRQLASFGPHAGPVDKVWFTGDDRRIYSTCTSENGVRTIRQWDAQRSNVALCQIEGEQASDASFSPSGRWLLVHRGRKVPEIVDVNAGPGKPSIVLAEFPQGTASTGFGPDDKLMASIHFDGRIIFWEAATGRRQRVLDLPASARLGNFSHDGRYFAASTDKGRIYLFRLSNGHAQER
jgi:serine/threonine protein kinase/WD40 repeat protein